MAQPNSPADDAADGGGRRTPGAAESTPVEETRTTPDAERTSVLGEGDRTTPYEPDRAPAPAVPARPRDDASDASSDASSRGATEVIEPVRPAERERERERVAATDADRRATDEPAPAAAAGTTTDTVPVAPTERQPVLAPAAEPLPPVKKGNRLAGTAWVLLAAGLFQVLFFGLNALVALVFGGTTAAVTDQIRQVAASPLAWLPVLLFALLFELTVLLVNRAGRVAYVLASLIVALIVYVLTVLLFSLIVRHALGDANTLAQTFLNWEFILVGLVARETMLWTGLAIGARGIRVRRRNREARRRFEEERGDARD